MRLPTPHSPTSHTQVVFHERASQLPTPQPVGPAARGEAARNDETATTSLAAGALERPAVLLTDTEQYRENPALHKHHKLARSLLSAGFAKELKPDAEERKRLTTLVESPPTQRLREEVCSHRGTSRATRLCFFCCTPCCECSSV